MGQKQTSTEATRANRALMRSQGYRETTIVISEEIAAAVDQAVREKRFRNKRDAYFHALKIVFVRPEQSVV